MWWLAAFVHQLEAAMHWADAYLAEQRGEMLFAANCKCRQADAEGRRDRALLNWRLRNG
jgi:hypothetical protein